MVRLAPALLLVALLFPNASALASEPEPLVEPAPTAVAEPTGALCLLFGEGEEPEVPTVAVCGFLYDPAGNVTQIVDASSGLPTARTVDYAYDDLNRLLTATATGVAQGQTPYTQTYTYDAIGNILTGPAGTYSYAGHQGTSYANPHAATSVGSDALTYDHNGNLLTRGSNNSYAWDYANRMVSSVTGTHASAYAYDAGGTRVKLTEDGTTTLFPSGGYEVTAGVPTKQIEANGVTVATIVGTGANAVPRYVHTDHLTGSNVVTSQNGTVDELMDYYPYGGIRIDQKVGTYGVREKYAGHEYDQATGLSYMGARYYDAATGRFLSADPAFLAVGDSQKLKSLANINQEAYLSNPQFANSCAYSLNNPVTVRDESGNFPIAIVAAAYAYAYAPVWVPAAISAVSGLGAAVASWNLGAGVGHAIEGDHAAANRSFDASVAASTTAGLAAGGILAAGEALGAGLQSKEGQGASAAKQAGDTSAKVHGNSLRSTRTNYGYTLRDQDTKQILKFGETQNPAARYSQKYLDSHNAYLNPETSGSKVEIHQWQHNQITQYKAQNGNLPPLNKSEW